MLTANRPARPAALMPALPHVVALVLTLACALITSAVPAQAREPVTPAELARITGMDRALDEVAKGIASQGDQLAADGQAIGDAASFAATWKKVCDAAFDSTKLKTAFAARLTGKLTPAETNAIADFYTSALGKRLVAAEVASGTEAGQQEMIAKAQQLMQALTADKRRDKVIEEIIVVTKINEMSTALAINMSRAVMIGMSTANQSAGRMTLEDIVTATEQQKPQIAKEMAAVVKLSLAYAYRDMSIADLDSYAAFLSKPAGRKFSLVILDGLDAVLSEAGLTFGRQLAAEFGRKPI